MNREIKFRVWDTELKEFFEPIYEAYKGRLLDISISLSGGLLRRTLEEPCEHQSRFKDRYVLMQYTGLKDKNGKEIYEGDILATSNNNPDYDFWKKEDHGYTSVIWSKENDCWLGSRWTWEKEDESVYYLNFIEVIGNIHENPELLK